MGALALTAVSLAAKNATQIASENHCDKYTFEELGAKLRADRAGIPAPEKLGAPVKIEGDVVYFYNGKPGALTEVSGVPESFGGKLELAKEVPPEFIRNLWQHGAAKRGSEWVEQKRVVRATQQTSSRPQSRQGPGSPRRTTNYEDTPTGRRSPTLGPSGG